MATTKPKPLGVSSSPLTSLQQIQAGQHEIDQKLDHLIRSLRLHFASHTHRKARFNGRHDPHDYSLNDIMD